MEQTDEKDPDSLMAAQTALLIAEMEAIIVRAKLILADRARSSSEGKVVTLVTEKSAVP